MISKDRIALKFLISVLLFASAVSPSSSSLTCNGSVFNEKAAAGEHISHNLTVGLSPDAPEPVDIKVELLDWAQSPTGANVGVNDSLQSSAYSGKKLLSVSPEEFSLSPGSSQNVTVEGTMPAGEGGRYAIVSVCTVPHSTGKGVSVSFGMNALVLLTIRGSRLSLTGEIEDLRLSGPASSQGQNGTVRNGTVRNGIIQNGTMTFKNTGNYHYSFDAGFSLMDDSGRIVAEESPEIAGSIIPGATRQVDFSLHPGRQLLAGSYVLRANVSLENGTILASKDIALKI